MFTACKNGKRLVDIKANIAEVKSYSSTADITIYGNKALSNYRVKQYCIYPDKLRIETLQPDFLRNKVVVKNGDEWKIYHPLINQILEMSKLMEEDELILMGIIHKDLFTSSSSTVSDNEFEGKKCICIKSIIPSGNQYRKTAVLYIDEDKKIPMGMDILDDKGNKKIEIKYSEYKSNEVFSDKLFDLK